MSAYGSYKPIWFHMSRKSSQGTILFRKLKRDFIFRNIVSYVDIWFHATRYHSVWFNTEILNKQYCSICGTKFRYEQHCFKCWHMISRCSTLYHIGKWLIKGDIVSYVDKCFHNARYRFFCQRMFAVPYTVCRHIR